MSLERLGQDLDFGLGVAEPEVGDDKVVGPVELRPQVEVPGGVLPVVDPDARVAGGEGVEEGRQAVLLQVGDLALDLLVPATEEGCMLYNRGSTDMYSVYCTSNPKHVGLRPCTISEETEMYFVFRIST